MVVRVVSGMVGTIVTLVVVKGMTVLDVGKGGMVVVEGIFKLVEVAGIVVVIGADVVVVDGSLLFVVVVIVMGRSEEGGEITKGEVVMLPKVVVVVLGVVVDTDVLGSERVVVVSDGTSVVDDVRVVVGQCW